ncbi:C2 domain-containing protein [Cryptosporidium muris RN66]|uniref:C2 domain-containing protein n=1 Tax=Cryptosporidium muris (strain RN66) TaxID=441375 RepID=B6ABD5_CRYMR|nr:C2 domain-containing protein [Cryptosporidium muris RN66]EEA05687.1 C2 domain-containing protein [Cryptosporidium muris RN66]|eukprot:XP_002140036.1 C2 domain-containing protein [Cryptosporidium muris RN66]
MLQPTTEYNIRIDVYELRDLKFNNGSQDITPNPYVEVKVGDQIRTTSKQTAVSSASIQASYNFTVTLTKADFECSSIEVNVMHAFILSSATIGSHILSFNYIYNRNQHWMYRNWVPLILAEKPWEVMGYILLTVGIFAPADQIPVIDESSALVNGSENEQVARIAAGPEVTLTLYNLGINIYKGQDIAPITGMYNLVEPFVCVRHGVSTMSTKCIKNESNPVWKVMISLPAYSPCSDSNVIIELWNGESKPTLLGKFRLDAFRLFKEPFPLTWVNLYWTQPPSGGAAELFASSNTSVTSLVPSSYAGRLLISAIAQKCQKCNIKSIQSAPLVNEPPMTRYILWIDVYEVTCRPDYQGEVILEFCIGPQTVASPSMPMYREPLIFDSQSGRLDETYFYLSDGQDPWDLFIYAITGSGEGLWTSAKYSKLSFTRIALENISREVAGNPTWYSLKSIYDSNNGYIFNVLADITIVAANTASDRPERLEYSLNHFFFRSFIYEGMNLPGISSILPNPYVKISIGDQSIQTRTIETTYVPQWYEAYETKVSLPKNLSLASDILIEVYHQNLSYIGYEQRLGYTTYKLTEVPKVWKTLPVWLKLRSTIGNAQNNTNTMILCSFELVSEIEVKNYPFYDDIRPSTIPADIRLFIVGIRMFESIKNPVVSISYGREVDTSSVPLWHDTTPSNATGNEGNWNFLHDFAITAELPKRHVFQSYFEVTVHGEVSGYSGNSDSISGFGTLYFNNTIPWYDEDTKKDSDKFFHLTTEEDIFLESSIEKNSIVGTTQNTEEDKNNKKVLNNMKSLVAPTSALASTGSIYDPDAANSLLYPVVDLIRADNRSLEIEVDINKVSQDNTDNKYINILADDEDQANMASKLKAVGTIFGFDATLLNFDLKVFADDEVDERFEIPYEMEQDLDLTELPYKSLPLVQLNSKGLYYVVGYLKYILCITQQPRDGQDYIVRNQIKRLEEEELKNFTTARQWIADQYTSMKPIVARCYILSARGLLPPSGDANPSVYIYIRSQESDSNISKSKKRSLYPSNIRDIGYVRHQGYRPEFNQVYEIGCILPRNAFVKISLIGTGTMSEEVIGTTFIDIEDRWFHPKVRTMIETNTVPIELRTLRIDNSIVSHGTLRAWYEILSEQAAKAIPVTPLASADPQTFQLRIVVWRVRQVPVESNTSISLYVSAVYNQEENNSETQSTETHYNSKDGTGVFNWRFVYNIKIPTQYPILKVQLWSYGLIQSENIGECSIDFSNDFGKARKHSSQILRIPRTWYGFTHPIQTNLQQGQVELEIAIVPSKISDVNPVGKGRDPPNVDPFLEDITENRTYVDWKGIGEVISSATSSIWTKAKRAFIIGAIIGVIALIIFLIVVLKN